MSSGICRLSQTLRRGSPETYRALKFVVGSVRLYSIILTEGSIVDPCYETWE